MTTYNPKAVANWFLDRAEFDGETLSPMKLQKLVYLAHGWRLGLRGEPLLNEEVQAWDYGPVVSSLYHEFKDFGASPITRRAISMEMGPGGEWRAVTPGVPPTDKDEIALLERIWEVYRGYSGSQLSTMTHKAGSPWSITRDRMDKRLRSTVISNTEIQEGFEALAKRNRSANESRRA